jgi:hypothetical protein
MDYGATTAHRFNKNIYVDDIESYTSKAGTKSKIDLD